MNPPAISCIIPAHNAERYLAESLDSVLAQTRPVSEIIVVDDGSTDGTSDVVARYASRVRYIHQPQAGATAARNRALEVARGEFIAFQDADDLWHIEKLARQLARFEAVGGLDACCTHAENFLSPEFAGREQEYQHHRLGRPIPGYTAPTLLARRDLFLRTGPFDESLEHSSVTDWFMRALDAGARIEMLPDPLVRRRIHASNFSTLRADHSLDQFLLLLKKSLDQRRRTAV